MSEKDGSLLAATTEDESKTRGGDDGEEMVISSCKTRLKCYVHDLITTDR